ncbi:acyl-CoA thioesterase [Hydrogenimonas urashimensis]|uniref:acyl-CoA thioesterase n=1 Tax=Hydrogenimonas urashimensis TaxID=2740515 RepID=UPI001915DEAE|nr:acyl-CoA thioesterase [Hydrogenimonas urashimensis]
MAASPLFGHRFTVPEKAIDFNGHVGNVNYLQWMVEAAAAHSESVGWDFERCIKETGGTWVAKSHHIEYHRPAFAGEKLQIETWLDSIEKIKAVRRYRITRISDGTLLCEGRSEWIFVHAETMRPARIPEAVVRAFRQEGEKRT